MKYHFVSGLVTLFCLQGVIAQVDKIEIIHKRDIKSDLGGGDPCLALGPDGSSLFVANDKDSRIFEYDTMIGKQRRVFDTKLEYVQCVEISPDGMKLAAGANGLVLFDLKNRKMLFHHNESNRVNSVAFSANNKFVVLGTVDKVVKILSLPEGKEWQSFAGSRGPVVCVSFSPDGSDCASGGIDQVLRIWDVKNGKEKQGISTPLSVTSALAYSQDGRYLAFSSIQKSDKFIDPLSFRSPNEIKVWDFQKGKVRSTITEKMTRINALFVARDAEYVVAASDSGLALAWQRDRDTAEYLAIWKNTRCRALTISQDFKKMATANADGSIAIWELKWPRSK